MKYKSVEKFDLFFFLVTVILILIFAVFAKAQSNEISDPETVTSGQRVHARKIYQNQSKEVSRI